MTNNKQGTANRGTLLLFLLIFISLAGICQDSVLIPDRGKEIRDFVPGNWRIIRMEKADLNKDSLEDVVMVISTTDSIENNPERVLIILFKEIPGYKVSAIGDHVIGCFMCGGVVGDYFTGLTLNKEKQCIYIEHSSQLTTPSGSSTHQFRYQHGNWYLIGKESHTWERNGDCHQLDESENFITGIIISSEINSRCKKIVTKKKVKPKPLVKLSDFSMD